MTGNGWRFVLLGCAAAISGALHLSPAMAGPRDDQAAKVVLELFTSQGCSSCPPADALLERYTRRDDVIALSLPVDYWDRLGWKDTFASPAFSERQRRYAATRGDGEVYTPQVVVNGRFGVIGSIGADVDRGIEQAKALARVCPIKIDVDRGTNMISVAALRDASAQACPGTATLYVAKVQRAGTVTIKRGENGGRAITYHHIVRSLDAVASWSGGSLTYAVPKGAASPDEFFVAILQEGRTGPILNARLISGG